MPFKALVQFPIIGLYNANGSFEHFASPQPQQSSGAPQQSQASLPTTIQELLDRATSTDVYYLWSPVSNAAVRVFVYVDLTSKKKWALVLRYNRRAGSNPPLRPIMTGDFPIPPLKAITPVDLPAGNSPQTANNQTIQTTQTTQTTSQPEILYDEEEMLKFADETTTNSWGHVDPSYLSQFVIKEVAYFGMTTNHGRIVNFTSASPGAIEFTRNLAGKFNAGRCFCTQPGTLFKKTETAALPQYAKRFQNVEISPITPSKSIEALSDKKQPEPGISSPFEIPGAAYWSIRADGTRWEVDNSLDPHILKPEDRPKDYDASLHHKYDTLHMVFVR